jgi:hypothetical protein
MVISMRTAIFWNVVPYSLVNIWQPEEEKNGESGVDEARRGTGT